MARFYDNDKQFITSLEKYSWKLDKNLVRGLFRRDFATYYDSAKAGITGANHYLSSSMDSGILGIKVIIVCEWLKFIFENRDEKVVFGNFGLLGETAEFLSMNPNEIFDFVFSIVELNISIGILDENFKRTTIKEEMLKRALLKRLSLNIKGKSYAKNSLASINDYDLSKVITAHRSILEHYLLKKDSYTFGDIDSITDALINLGFSVTIANDISSILKNKLRLKEQKIAQEIERQKRVEEQKKKLEERTNRPKKEIKPLRTASDIEKVLSTYFDFEHNESTKYLTLDEVVYCVALLKGLDKTREEIDNFIRIVTEYNRDYGENPITRFMEIKHKLMFYKSKGMIELIDILREIDEAIALIPSVVGDDYILYKNYIGGELDKGEDIVKYKREYENVLAEARREEIDQSELVCKTK